MDYLRIAENNQRQAWSVLEETGLISEWQAIGAEVNIVGSVKTGLMMQNRDIDMHIYTNTLSIIDSFSVIQRLASKLALKEIQYRNLIDTEEACIEWHAYYESEIGELWKFDMIHLLRGSKYDGVVEQVTAAIADKLTPETRVAILKIKSQVPEGISIPGIEIYRAVFDGRVDNFSDFEIWRERNPLIDSLGWMP